MYDSSGRLVRSGRFRPDAVWPMRRSCAVRLAIGWVARVCVGMLLVVAICTVVCVRVFGDSVAWSVVGCLFALVPLAGLLLAVAFGARGAVAAGPRWVAVRLVVRWRVVDLGQVRVVRFSDGPSFGGGGMGGFGPWNRLGGPARLGPGPTGGAPASPPQDPDGGSVVLEDASGNRVDIGVDALDAGLGAVVRAGLPSDAVVDPGAARALGEVPAPEGAEHRL